MIERRSRIGTENRAGNAFRAPCLSPTRSSRSLTVICCSPSLCTQWISPRRCQKRVRGPQRLSRRSGSCSSHARSFAPRLERLHRARLPSRQLRIRRCLVWRRSRVCSTSPSKGFTNCVCPGGCRCLLLSYARDPCGRNRRSTSGSRGGSARPVDRRRSRRMPDLALNDRIGVLPIPDSASAMSEVSTRRSSW